MSIPFYNAGKEMTPEKKALRTIGVKPFNPRNELTGAQKAMNLTKHIEKQDYRRTRIRDATMLEDFYEADDKKKILPLLAEKWGLEKSDGTADIARVNEIITRQRRDGVRIAAMASKVEAIRKIQQARLIDNANEYMMFLEDNHSRLVDLKVNGKKEWIEVELEEIEKADDIVVKTKKIPIDTAIQNNYEQIVRLGKTEADALKSYDGNPVNMKFTKENHLHIEVVADKEFIEQFDRIRGENEVRE